MHREVYTFLFPIRLLSVGECLVYRPACAGSYLNDVLKPGCACNPIVVGFSCYIGGS